MVASLWKLVHELELYAKEAEYGCLKLKQVLESMACSYEEDLPQVPESSLLEAYPLDYEDPEWNLLHSSTKTTLFVTILDKLHCTVLWPPWGQKVGELLNLIAVWSPTPAGAKFVANGGIERKRRCFYKASPKLVGDSSRSKFRRARDATSTVLVAFRHSLTRNSTRDLNGEIFKLWTALLKYKPSWRNAL